jgi:hypothetical protein
MICDFQADLQLKARTKYVKIVDEELELKLKFNQDGERAVSMEEKSNFTPIGNFVRLSGSSHLMKPYETRRKHMILHHGPFLTLSLSLLCSCFGNHAAGCEREKLS